ncbi:hypothetical protein [Streptomyces sp. NPDC003730]
MTRTPTGRTDHVVVAGARECLVTSAGRTAQGHAAGTPLPVAHPFARSGPFRPRSLVCGTDDAFLAGCATTPGVGVPTVLASGAPAAIRITGAPARAGAAKGGRR